MLRQKNRHSTIIRSDGSTGGGAVSPLPSGVELRPSLSWADSFFRGPDLSISLGSFAIRANETGGRLAGWSLFGDEVQRVSALYTMYWRAGEETSRQVPFFRTSAATGSPARNQRFTFSSPLPPDSTIAGWRLYEGRESVTLRCRENPVPVRAIKLGEFTAGRSLGEAGEPNDVPFRARPEGVVSSHPTGAATVGRSVFGGKLQWTSLARLRVEVEGRLFLARHSTVETPLLPDTPYTINLLDLGLSTTVTFDGVTHPDRWFDWGV